VLLLLAAVSKTSVLLATGTFANLVSSVTPFIVAWELALGAWLLAGRRPSIARQASFLTFAAFSLFNLRSAWADVANCTCFGVSAITPTFMLAVDLIALAFLCVSKPCDDDSARETIVPLATATCFAMALAILLPLDHVSRTSDGQLKVEDWPSAELAVTAGSVAEWTFRVSNATPNAVTVTALPCSCDCLTVRLQKLSLATGESIVGTATADFRERPDFVGNLRLTSVGLADDHNRPLFTLVREVKVGPAQSTDAAHRHGGFAP